MGLYKTSIFSIFTFIKDNDLKFCTRSYSSCVYRKVCKMMTSHFRTLSANQNGERLAYMLFNAVINLKTRKC